MWWADNLYILASTKATMRAMVEECTAALAKWGLCWKLSSAQMLVSPNVPLEDREMQFEAPIIEGTRETVIFDFVETLMVLGCPIDGVGSPRLCSTTA